MKTTKELHDEEQQEAAYAAFEALRESCISQVLNLREESLPWWRRAMRFLCFSSNYDLK